jgi:hypothetical protein
MFSNIVRIFSPPYMTIVLNDCSTHTHEVFLHQQNTICLCMSCRRLQCGKVFLKRSAFLNHDVCMLYFGLTEAFRHAISVFCAKHEHIQTWRALLAMFRVFVWLCPGRTVRHGKTLPFSFRRLYQGVPGL